MKLLEMSLTQERVKETDILDEHYIVDLIEFYGFYISKAFDGNGKEIVNQYRIVIPKIWEKLNVFKTLSVNYLYGHWLFSSEAFERHVVRVLFFLSGTPGDKTTPRKSVSQLIPFLSETRIANEDYSGLEYIFMNKRANSDRHPTFENDATISPRGCFLIIPTSKSSLPDLVTLLPIKKKSRYFIGWQMKNYTTALLEISTLGKEIKKFSDVLTGQGCKGGVFVILLNGMGTAEVESLRGRVINRETLPILEQQYQGATKLKDIFTELPHTVELLIPTQDDLKDYFGEEALRELSSTKVHWKSSGGKSIHQKRSPGSH